MATKLQGKVAVVTGASKGIGADIARQLAADGAAVVVNYASSKAGADKVVADITGRGGRAVAVKADVAKPEDIKSLFAEAVKAFGRVDVLVNNAGISQPKGLLEISEAEWDQTMAVNLKGMFNWCKAVAPAMLDRQAGRIVNISSVSAHTGAGFGAVSRFAYCAAKAGVLGLTRGLAKELAPDVTVNAICPGTVLTDLTSRMIDQNRDNILRTIPLRRLGTPEDIAEVVAFLATVTPNFITGEVVDVDGGQWVN
jgi:3-oxoacyl-[acyl-carrier protein] reductase